MEKSSMIGRLFLVVIVLLVIVQSWIVITQNRYLVNHLDEIASKKVIIQGDKILDEDGNVIHVIKRKGAGRVDAEENGEAASVEGEGAAFTDVKELMERAKAFKFRVGKVGGSFNYAVSSDPKTFNLILNREATTSDLMRYTYDPLIRENYITGEWEGVLADSWEMSDDGLECVVHLRRDVKFFDGEPMTADDVVFTYNGLLGNKQIDVGDKTAMIFRDERGGRTIEREMKVEKVDDYTVRFTFPWKTYSALRKVSQMVYPEHVLRKYVEDGTFNTTWDVSTDPKRIIGTGPWRPCEYRSGERFVIERNPNYWRKDEVGQTVPYIEKIVFAVIPEKSTALLKFKAGEVDFLALGGSDVPVLLDVPEGERDFTIFGTGPSATISYMCFNMNHGRDPETGVPYVKPHKLKWFTNLKFRKAMAHCLDRETWINNFMNGFGIPLWSPLSPASTEFYNSDVTKYPFDLSKAGALLDEVAYIDRDRDGVREDPDGNPIEFTILTSARDERGLRPINMFISDLKKVGVNAKYVIQQTNTFHDKLWQTYDFECTFIGELAGYEVGGIRGLFTTWSSYRFYKPNYTESGKAISENIENQEPWESELDTLFAEYEKELDKEKRKGIGFEIQKVVSDNLPVIFTVVNERVFAIKNKYSNLNPTVRFYPIIWPMMEYLYEAK